MKIPRHLDVESMIDWIMELLRRPQERIKTVQINVLIPDAVQPEIDYITTESIHADWAPNGTTILTVGIKTTPAPGANYIVTFKIYDDPIDGSPATIATVTVTSGTTEAETSTLTNDTVAAGQIIKAVIPATAGVKELHCFVNYLIDD